MKYAAEIFNRKQRTLYKKTYLRFITHLGSNCLNSYQNKNYFEKTLSVGLRTHTRKQRVSYETIHMDLTWTDSLEQTKQRKIYYMGGVCSTYGGEKECI
jgi:hypothetical protein